MATQIVIANRNGLAEGPDGSKYRLVRGRTLADARHPLAAAHPDLFSPHVIDLPYDGDEGDPSSAATAMVEELEHARDEYREQLAAIVDVLFRLNLLPAEEQTKEPGWLAKAVEDALTARQTGADPAPEAPEMPAPKRTRAPRRPAVQHAEE